MQNYNKTLNILSQNKPSNIEINNKNLHFEFIGKDNNFEIGKVTNNKKLFRAYIDIIAAYKLNFTASLFAKYMQKTQPDKSELFTMFAEVRIICLAAMRFKGSKTNIKSYINKFYEKLLSKEIYDSSPFDYILYKCSLLDSQSPQSNNKQLEQIYKHIKNEDKFYKLIADYISQETTEKTEQKQQANSKQNKQNKIDSNKTNDTESNNNKKDSIEDPTSPNSELDFQGEIKTDNKASLNNKPSNTPTEINYSIFTKEFDEIINAEKLLSIQDKDKLWPTLDSYFNDNDDIDRRKLSKFTQKLLNKVKPKHSINKEEGILNSKYFSQLIINSKFDRIYKEQEKHLEKESFISLLLDNSGSMYGRPIRITSKICYQISKILERIGINHEILGYTTSSWHGGKSMKKWKKAQSKKCPGRINDIRHVIIKDSSTPINKAKTNLSLLSKEGYLKENIDGEALNWCFNKNKLAEYPNKIIIVLSDGSPIDDATNSLNPKGFLENHLHHEISKIERNPNYKIIGCGISDDLKKFYKNHIVIKDYENLGNEFLEKICDYI